MNLHAGTPSIIMRSTIIIFEQIVLLFLQFAVS